VLAQQIVRPPCEQVISLSWQDDPRDRRLSP
jgi:hypothetical protein